MGGYLRHRYQGGMDLAHRVSYKENKGPIPEGMIVRHTCDNPPCINPDHLVLGTHQDNMNDMVERGRQVCEKGEAHFNAELTEEAVRDILRAIPEWTSKSASEFARKYNVSARNIRLIKNGKAWKHVRLESTCKNT